VEGKKTPATELQLRRQESQAETHRYPEGIWGVWSEQWPRRVKKGGKLKPAEQGEDATVGVLRSWRKITIGHLGDFRNGT